MIRSFKNRIEAGQKLATKLSDYQDSKSTVVFGLSRGGVMVAAEIARILNLPLNVMVVKKIGHPAYSEYAIGALTLGVEPVFNERERDDADPDWLNFTLKQLRQAIKKQTKFYQVELLDIPSIKNKNVILVDDGIATGYSLEASIKTIQQYSPKSIMVAAPVASSEGYNALKRIVDKIILFIPTRHFLGSVGLHYIDFCQTEDIEVKNALWSINKPRR